MSEEKRMVDAFEVRHAIFLGNKEVLFCINPASADTPYMVCNCDYLMGMEHFFDGVGGDDYLELMGEFLTRVQVQYEAVKAQRSEITVPLACFTAEQCIPDDYRTSLENKVAVIRAGCMRPEYRTASSQLVLVTGGFGASPNARGRAIFTTELYSGKESRWNRQDILGIIRPEYMPDWAKERLVQIQASKHKKRPAPER